MNSAKELPLDTKTAQSRYLQEVKLPESTFQFPQQNVASNAIDDLTKAMADSLANPLDYPPLEQSMIAGDQVAIALQSNLPRPNEVVKALLAQIATLDFVIVCSAETAKQLESMGEVNGKVVVHDSTDKNALAMLGIDEKAAPVYINRSLFEADIVIPVAAAPGVNEEVVDCIYPYFSGVEDQDRFEERSPKARGGQVRMANNQLGTFWGIQLVHGPGDRIHQIVSGELGAAAYKAKQEMSQLWAVSTTADAELVVATIESESTLQNWDHFCSAILAADQAVLSGAPIVICSEIVHGPPRKVRSALTQQFEGHTMDKLNNTLRKVAEIVSERNVFLESKLSQAITEELGLGCITSKDELQRIVDRHPQGVLLRDAHRCNLQTTA